MAVFRKVHTTFWSDPWVNDLTPEQRYFYLYLMTNEHTKQCGIYEVSKRQISFETGYSIDRVSILLEYFIKSGKIRYNEQTKEIALKNWAKYNGSTSPKVQSCIRTEFESVKDRVLIEYLYSIDTASQKEEEKEEEKEEKKEDSPVKPAFPDFSKLESWMVEPLKIWFDYKKEKKQGYKPIGWNSLVEKIRKEYTNEAELMEAVNYSTSKNYTGLFRESKPAQQNESTAVTDDIDRFWKQ